MARISLPTMLILALLTFAVCGAGLMCLELLTHYSVLAAGVPVQTLSFSIVLLAVLIAIPALYGSISHDAYRMRTPSARPPDLVLRMPLRLAFSDGILNTKAY